MIDHTAARVETIKRVLSDESVSIIPLNMRLLWVVRAYNIEGGVS